MNYIPTAVSKTIKAQYRNIFFKKKNCGKAHLAAVQNIIFYVYPLQ